MQTRIAVDETTLDHTIFRAAFDRFRSLIEYNSRGHPFTNFREGLAAAEEAYKPRLREHALSLLNPAFWSTDTAGSGEILERTIAAIEINEPHKVLQNNLVFWQNRYGHANRAHRALLEARTDGKLRAEIERQLFGLFHGTTDEGATFDRLADLTYAKYPLLAYLFFLKNMDRFMPILPSTFDKAFRELNIDLVTQSNCSWENYTHFNSTLQHICDALRQVGGVKDARLIDAHSFCWILERSDQPEPGAEGNVRRRGPDAGRIFSSRERSIVEMKDSIMQTVGQARGQIEQRQVKVKELRMSEAEIEPLLLELLTRQENRCALTGLKIQFRGDHDDDNLLPSPDRIDSNGHYERGNLQVVCRFVNFWKQASDNEEFKRLLMLVRGLEE